MNHRELIDGRSPKSRGTRVGVVVARTRQGIVIEVETASYAQSGAACAPLKPGDGVVFDEGRPEQEEQGGRVFSVEPVRPSGRS